MIRYLHEKSCGSEYTVWMDMFNNFINDTVLIELVRGGSGFTWTNKRENPIRSNLDRVLVNRAWEQHFPKLRVRALTRIGSDHNPILVDDEREEVKIKRWLIF
jgi:endonuclease/exonuclease/phosphatase family metal-dependent hydrolase